MIHEYVTTHVVTGTQILTDGWTGYNGLDKIGTARVVARSMISADDRNN